MLVTIEQIREKGLELNEPVGLELLSEALDGLNGDAGFKATRPAQLQALLRRTGEGVLLEGSLGLAVTAPCRRCLVPVELDLPVTFSLNLVPAPRVRPEETEVADDKSDKKKKNTDADEEAGTFELDDAEHELFDGKTIHLDPIVREQVLLALPMNAICREDCKGLCAQCGQNLNEKKCGCEPKVVDPRLAVLKNIKLN